MMGFVHAAHRVGGARSGANDPDRQPAGRSGVSICGMGDALLVPATDDADPATVPDRLQDRQIMRAGNSEDAFDAERFEGVSSCESTIPDD